MIQPGIFAKTFNRPTLTKVLDAVYAHGFRTLQFNMVCAGLASMPDFIPESLLQQIATTVADRNLTISALSGTFNMIHPNKTVRQKGLQSLELLIQNATAMGTSIITLCTGSCHAEDMWRFHPGNNSAEAWADLCDTMEQALEKAEAADIVLAIEPELSNVINTTEKAKRLMDEMQSKNLKIVFDPANLFEIATSKEIEKLISEGLYLLGEHIVLTHAKDRKADGSFTAAGLGILPYPFFLKMLKETGYDGNLITHGLTEDEAHPCCIFLNQQLSLL